MVIVHPLIRNLVIDIDCVELKKKKKFIKFGSGINSGYFDSVTEF